MTARVILLLFVILAACAAPRDKVIVYEPVMAETAPCAPGEDTPGDGIGGTGCGPAE